MSRADLAKSNFMKGYNCSQAVLLAFADLAHLDEETALKISSSFGGRHGPHARSVRYRERLLWRRA